MKNKHRVVLLVVGIFFLSISSSFRSDSNKKIVVIDAGHGGKDVGAVFKNYTEVAVVETLAEKIKLLAASENIQIVLLRNKGEFMSLDERVAKTNTLRPDLLISLHVNAADEAKNGVEAYVSTENSYYSSSLEVANSLNKNLVRKGFKNQKVKHARFTIIRTTNCPSILLELGFITNAKDRAYITQEKGQNEIAKAIITAL